MREKLSQKVLNLKSSGIRAFFDMANEIPDVISLGVGEPDFDTPWHIREAGIQALQSGKTFYTSNAGLQELRAAISSYTKRKTGLTYNPENQIIVTVGGSEAIDLALRALLNAGDEVIYLEPGFVSYYPCIKLADGVPVPIRLTEENRFRLKPEQLEAAVTPKSKVLILSYPNNPTGAVMEKEDLEALLPVIQKHDLIVISDEIYGELTYGVKHCSIAGLPGMEQRTIIINGFSKSFAMTGWRLGYALGNHEIIEQMVKIHQFAVMCAPTISQYAAIEAMEQGDGDIEAMRESYDQRRKFLYHELQRLGLPCFEPQGAFYMFPNIREFGLSSGEFALKLLKEEKVAVVPGDSFGECGEGFVRISYAASLQNLKEAVNRIFRFLSRYRLRKGLLMKTWEKNIRQVLPYIPGEQPKQADIIKLNTNENPYPPSPRVAETLEQFQTGELRLYPDPDSNILVEALADFYQIDRSRIFVGVGSDDVLAVSFLTFFNSGKPVLFPDITYSFYDVWARLFQIPFEQIPLDGEFQIRKSDYFRENGGVVFPNPNAPTGILMGLPEIEDIISHNQDVVVIVDEAYIDFGGISAFPLLDKYDNLLIIQTVSKSRALAGLRVGYAFGSPQLISYLNDVRNSFNSYTMNRLTQTLGAAAVRDREYFERTNALIIATRERIKRELKQLGFSFQDSKSNFLFVTHPSVKAGVIYESLRAAGIYVRHFSKPERISDYLRIAVGTDQEMDCLLIKLKEILQQHGDLHGNTGECQ